jgi:hypothetical protein
VIEARAGGATTVRIVPGHPCRADIDGNEMLVGTQPLVTQIGNSRWSGDDPDHSARDVDRGTTLRKDGMAIVRIRDTQNAGIEVFDPRGVVMLHVTADGAVANARGEILRRAAATRTAIQIGDSMVTGTSDVALGALATAPELVPEVRALAACHRLMIARGGPGPATPDGPDGRDGK